MIINESEPKVDRVTYKGIIFNDRRKVTKAEASDGIGRTWEVFSESFAPVRVRDQLTRQVQIVGRDQVHH